MAQFNFDSSTVEVQSFDALPEGTYEVVISDSRFQATRNGSGEMLVLTLEVISGEYSGRKLWDRLNISNPNKTAVDIARQTLATICRAVGVVALEDTNELHDRPLLATVRVRKMPDDTLQNEIKGYRPRPDAGAAVAATPVVPHPNTPAAKRVPWAQ